MHERFDLFLPCAHGVEPWLVEEVQRCLPDRSVQAVRTGVHVQGDWRDVFSLNLHRRLAQRVLICLKKQLYQNEKDLYDLARQLNWSDWFSTRQTFKVEVTAQHSPLKSLRFAGLTVKDAVVVSFRDQCSERPSVDTHRPDIRLYLHLEKADAYFYMDTSGEPLFKRGWRQETGQAPLKETLAAAMLAASGWQAQVPLYDPCCGSGTIAIEAAQIACRLPPGYQRVFAFEKLRPCQTTLQQRVWEDVRQAAMARVQSSPVPIFGSDVAHRMVDFAVHNAGLAGVGDVVQWRGGDMRQRLAPSEEAGVLILNPPYGERIGVQGFGTQIPLHSAEPLNGDVTSSESEPDPQGLVFFRDLSSHWKKNYIGWTAWILSPQAQLPGLLRLKATRRVPLWNGPIECRLFRFDLVQGRMMGAQASL